MTWLTDKEDSQERTGAQRVGLQTLMVMLCLYFVYSGVSELNFTSSLNRKFEDHIWLARTLGVAEVFGGVALLDTEAAFIGALMLTVVMACALITSVVHERTVAALESLFMFNVCGIIAMWRKSKLVSRP